MRTLQIFILGLSVALVSQAHANIRTNRQTQAELLEQEIDDQSKPMILTTSSMKWGPAPLKLPQGAKIVVLSGKPDYPGPFTLQLWIPAGYRIPAHWQYSDEFITVLSGSLHVGVGDVLDMNKGKLLTIGSFARIPARMHHFGWANEDTILQIHGIGPWGMKYVNPADEPNPEIDPAFAQQGATPPQNGVNNANAADYKNFNHISDEDNQSYESALVGNYNNNAQDTQVAAEMAMEMNPQPYNSSVPAAPQNKKSHPPHVVKKMAHNNKTKPESIHETMEEDRVSVKRK